MRNGVRWHCYQDKACADHVCIERRYVKSLTASSVCHATTYHREEPFRSDRLMQKYHYSRCAHVQGQVQCQHRVCLHPELQDPAEYVNQPSASQHNLSERLMD